MYYKIEGMYQNHRYYSRSRSDIQHMGNNMPYAAVSSPCSEMSIFTDDNKNVSSDTYSGVYNPCGLVAYSMFNDTISLFSKGSLICNGTDPTAPDSQCKKQGIAWKSDVATRFKRPPEDTPEEEQNRQHPQHYWREDGHTIPDVADEDYMVWMRMSPFNNFRKLYRIITTDLKPGNYSLSIKNNYPVTQLGGRKKIILSTTGWTGGKNLFLPIAYLAVGTLCILMTGGFIILGISRKGWLDVTVILVWHNSITHHITFFFEVMESVVDKRGV